MIPTPNLKASGAAVALYPENAAFAATLDRDDALYWPALAASDGCTASLAELNALLEADDCAPFLAASPDIPPTGRLNPRAFEACAGQGGV